MISLHFYLTNKNSKPLITGMTETIDHHKCCELIFCKSADCFSCSLTYHIQTDSSICCKCVCVCKWLFSFRFFFSSCFSAEELRKRNEVIRVLTKRVWVVETREEEVQKELSTDRQQFCELEQKLHNISQKCEDVEVPLSRHCKCILFIKKTNKLGNKAHPHQTYQKCF